MTPTHAVKKGRRYRYYVSTPLITGTRSDHAKGWRIPAGDIEGSGPRSAPRILCVGAGRRRSAVMLRP